ncbi:MAG: DUF4270 domain-containing protein [Bacteroidales bacterium]|nr:DUF4270 domain-containing protein [Bacteroidales bacterium]
MNRFPFFLLISLVVASLIAACDDNVSTVGSSLITDKVEIIIDSSFVATGKTVPNTAVQSRTLTQLLGCFHAEEYGELRSNFVTQFMPTISIDTTGMAEERIDSIKLLMFLDTGDFTGDSLVPMGLTVYPLTKALPSPIYSDFDPEGYYDPTPIATQMYTANALYSDSAAGLTYRPIYVDLPRQMAIDFYQKYIDSPSTFASPQEFVEWFPGFYVKSTFGSGLVVNITESRMQFYYRQHDVVETDSTSTDTLYNKVQILCTVSPEVITNNDIHYTMSESLKARADAGEVLIVAPLGYNAEIQLPLESLLQTFRNQGGNLSVLNTLTITLPVEEIPNDYDIDPPTQVLLVLSKDKEAFFEDSEISDNITSFVAEYSSTSKAYILSSMRSYFLEMLDRDSITEEDYTFTLLPVTVDVESSTSYITTVSPYVETPAMAKILVDEAKITLTFSKNTVNY